MSKLSKHVEILYSTSNSFVSLGLFRDKGQRAEVGDARPELVLRPHQLLRRHSQPLLLVQLLQRGDDLENGIEESIHNTPFDFNQL